MAKSIRRQTQSVAQRISIPKVEITIEEPKQNTETGLTEEISTSLPQASYQPIIPVPPSAPSLAPGTAKIRKRDGRVVEFQKAKIRIAMEKAAQAVNPNIDLRQFDLIADHVVRHVQIHFKDLIPDVEGVQDLVERSLMEYGLYDVAKAYILYRAERTKIREAQKPLPIERVENPKLTIIDELGHKKLIDLNTVYNIFTKASRDFEEIVDRQKLAENCFGQLYNEMPLLEFEKALVLTARAFIEKDPTYSKVALRIALQNLDREIFHEFPDGERDQTYRSFFIAHIKKAVANTRLNPDMLKYNLEELANYLEPKRDQLFEYLGFQVLYDRYLIREEGVDRKLETPQAFWMRVAMGLAINEGDQKEIWAKKFYDLMSTFRYVPSTPTLFHAGTTYPQLSSCYLNIVEDDLFHIFKAYSDNAQLSKYSGGIGTDWTNIRGTGALIKSTNVSSQGLIPFLKIANDVTLAINRSGKRRGASCVYLETWHYDIEDFLELRRNTGDERRRTHDINTANWVPDLFMKRVIEDGQWTLFSPEETPELHHLYGRAFDDKYRAYEEKADRGEIKLWRRVQAKDLWRKMITMLFETGHPWITFKDPSNIRSPQDHVGVIHSSNLCTEITLNTSKDETAVCNLGSINLARHIVNGKLDTGLLKETVQIAMRMLDNVIDLNFYPTEEARRSNLRHRPVGLGIMGFQDTLFMMGLDFDSEKAVQLADESQELIAHQTILSSSLLAKERGAYQTFAGSKWDRGIFPIDTLDQLEKERGMPISVARTARLDWTPVRESVKKYGLRNSNTMAIAPTATISNISGCFPCIEPIYSNLYVKSNMSGEFTIVNKYLVEELKRLGLWNETMLEEIKRNDGNIQEITAIPPRIRNQYKGVFDIDMEWLIKINAYRGKWIDQSQSFNIFIKGNSGKRLSNIYLLAWHMGLKTTYYLRTLGATSIEKSTIDVQKQTIHRFHEPGLTAPIPKEISPVSPPVLDEPIHAEATPNESSITVDPIFDTHLGSTSLTDDPACEVCQ